MSTEETPAGDESTAAPGPVVRMTMTPGQSVTASGAWTQIVEAAATAGGLGAGAGIAKARGGAAIKSIVDGFRDIKVEQARQAGETAREQLRQTGETAREAIRHGDGPE